MYKLLIAWSMLAASNLAFIPNAFGAAEPPDAEVVAQVGQQAPDFTAMAVGNKTVTLSALKGQVVVLNFFATW
ncbi:MAG: peroxiredoxin family protein [Candidatus Obscuribacterales bacterium]|jgi:thiol-disulfide isomerase/thioredoxin|nr:peroxiredoxin family protein [Candidatus Obscuribacterales bacterium]